MPDVGIREGMGMWVTVTSGRDAGRAVEATGERFTVGRDPACDLVLNDDRVSRQHAYLRVREDGRAELHDLGSANGTFVNGHRLTGPVMLSGGEELQVGDTVLTTATVAPAGRETQIGVTPAGAGAPSPSTIERLKLRRSVRIAVVLGSAAVLAAGVLGGLFAAGVIGGGDDEPSIPEIVDAVRPSTVVVNSLRDGEPRGSGTGWVLDAGEGLVVTNQHVTNGGSEFEVGVGDSQRSASLVSSAPCEDLALLQVEDRAGLVTLPLGSQGDLRQGQTVVAVGFPGTASERANLTATTGVVSVVETQFDEQAIDVPQYPNVVQTDAAINPGNSGGPLVDTEARLVGVNSAGITLRGGRTIQGQGYAIGVDRVKEVLQRLRTGRSIGWAGMGFVHVPDPSEVADELSQAGLPPQAGLVVTHAVPGTPAAEAGFGQSPVLVAAVNGQSMNGSLAAYCEAIGQGEEGEDAVFTVFEPGTFAATDVRVPFH